MFLSDVVLFPRKAIIQKKTQKIITFHKNNKTRESPQVKIQTRQKMRIKSTYDARSTSRISLQRSKSKYSHSQKVVEDIQRYENDFSMFDRLTDKLKIKNVLNVLNEQQVPADIPCRDNQKQYIEEFILNAKSMGYAPQVLYIGGVPGIGKTLCVNKVIQKVQKRPQFQDKKFKFIYVNGMKIKQPHDVFKNILSQLTEGKIKTDSTKASYMLNDYFEKGITNQINVDPLIVKYLIIDEMDYLKTQEQQVIYTIVDWTRHKKSHLAIIGLSNTIDLPQSFSLKIASRFGNKRLIFPQYTANQIGEILRQRTKLIDGAFSNDAIEYICKKIGGQQTDIRKCLHILRESVNRHVANEKKMKKQNVQYVQNLPQWVVVEVVQDLYFDSFVDSYPQFPNSYKLVLLGMAAYFRAQRQPLTYSQLQHILAGEMRTVNQLRSILFDLKDLGLVSLRYMCIKNDNRINKEFRIPKNVEEEIITLLVDVDKIYMAHDAQARQIGQGYTPLDRLRNLRIS